MLVLNVNNVLKVFPWWMVIVRKHAKMDTICLNQAAMASVKGIFERNFETLSSIIL